MRILLALLLLIPSLSWGENNDLHGKFISCMVDLDTTDSDNNWKSQIVVKFKKKGEAFVFVSHIDINGSWRLINSYITGYNDPGDTRYIANLTQVRLQVPLTRGTKEIIINRQTLKVGNIIEYGSCNVLSEEKAIEITESKIDKHKQYLIKEREEHIKKIEELKSNQKI